MFMNCSYFHYPELPFPTFCSFLHGFFPLLASRHGRACVLGSALVGCLRETSGPSPAGPSLSSWGVVGFTQWGLSLTLCPSLPTYPRVLVFLLLGGREPPPPTAPHPTARPRPVCATPLPGRVQVSAHTPTVDGGQELTPRPL